MIANLQRLFISNLSILERGTSKVTPETSNRPGATTITAQISSLPTGTNAEQSGSEHETITNIRTTTIPASDNTVSLSRQSQQQQQQQQSSSSSSSVSSSSSSSSALIITDPCHPPHHHHHYHYRNSRPIMTQVQSDVPNIDYTIGIENLQDGALKIVSRIRPDWASDDLKCKIFTDGITNRLIGVYNEQNKNDMILIRVYGENTDLFIDRKMELRNMRVMHHAGLSAPVYCSFNNGISYGYSPGMVLDGITVKDGHISGLIAENMAMMHSLKPPRIVPKGDERREACLFPGINKFLVLISSAFPVSNGCKKLKSVCNIDKLDLEVFFLERELRRIDSPIVFCHNDLLLKNIVYSKTDDRVSFIDFEYSDYNYQAFDIANHFSEFCGVDDFDPSLYPTKDFQLKWLRRYLARWHQLTGNGNTTEDQFQTEVGELFDAVERFTLAAHLYWGLWALVQATNSSIDFDYLNFAQKRIDEYFRRKEIFFKDECTCRLSAHNGDGSI